MSWYMPYSMSLWFFFHATATTEIYTLSLHDALPICCRGERHCVVRSRTHGEGERRRVIARGRGAVHRQVVDPGRRDRKSTRLNSSHTVISYAVFCLKKKKIHHETHRDRHALLHYSQP